MDNRSESKENGQQAANSESGSKLPHSKTYRCAALQTTRENIMESKYTAEIHGPPHRFEPNQIYFVTSGTLYKKILFTTPEKLTFLRDTLLGEASRNDWVMEAWAVMANHYHFVARTAGDPRTLTRFLRAVHSKTAIWLNKGDGSPGRKVWYRYWETGLSYQASYLARLAYTHNNPAKHGLVKDAGDYPWCSKTWFLQNAKESFRRTVCSIKYDDVNVMDDF